MSYKLEENPVYLPREDSYQLQDAVKRFASGNCLEIGPGSGIQCKTAVLKEDVKSVLGIDLNQKAIDYCIKNNSDEKITYIQGDMFEPIKKNITKLKKFDTIIFNPPYLPNDNRIKDIALDGGPKGHEVTQKFLENAQKYMTKKGQIILLFSSYTNKDIIHEILDSKFYNFKEISKEKYDDEVLYVYLITQSNLKGITKKHNLKNLKLFNKGHRGLIYTAMLNNKKVALKVQRNESEAQGSVDNESRVLKILNDKKISFVPKLIFSEKNMFCYEFIDGNIIGNWVLNANKNKIKIILLQVLDYVKKLDELGFTKEEMHNPYKHIIITESENNINSSLIDFERCKESLRPKNFTQYCQYLISKPLTKILNEKNIILKKDTIISLAKKYNKNPCEIYESIKDIIKSA
jgi:HemK-related putative methylase